MRHLAVVVALCSVVLVPRTAEACSCVGGIPPCEAAWQVDAVFVAQVVRVERLSSQVRAYLVPLETLRGPSDILSIDTGLGGGDCGYDFHQGETYLIYARGDKSTGRYSTGICSRTRPLDQATEDIDYLRTTARTPSNVGVLRGTVSRTDPNYGGVSEPQPYPGIRITVVGKDVQEEVVSDQHGHYELLLPPGEYKVRADAPDGLYVAPLFPSVQLRSARGCAESNIYVYSDGRVTGRVIDARGQQVAALPLELLTQVSYRFLINARVLTRSDGRYEFTRVPPGKFYVAFDTLRPDPSGRGRTQRVFVPGTFDEATAQPAVLRPSERVMLADLVFPDTAGAVSVSGQVRTADGEIVRGANVYLRIAPPTSRFFSAPAAVSDTNGEFVLMVPVDDAYDITVELPGDLGRTRGVKLSVRPAHGERRIDVVIPSASK